MLRYLGCGGIGLLILIIASVSCGATHAGAAGYQSGWYYPYYPWYWGGLYSHYPWVNTHYIEYRGGYTRSGTLAPGYRYDPVNNVVLSKSGQPVYPNPHAVNDIKPASNAPNPRSLNPSPDTNAIKAAAGGCSGQNSCTGGGNAVTNKSGGNSPSGNGSSSCSGQSNCTGGGGAVTNKSGGASGSGSSNGATNSGSKSNAGSASGPAKGSGPSKPSGPSRSGSGSGGSRSGGGGKR